MVPVSYTHLEEEGFVLYYTDQCPFTCYWVPRVVEVAKEHNISLKVIHVTSREAAQNLSLIHISIWLDMFLTEWLIFLLRQPNSG